MICAWSVSAFTCWGTCSNLLDPNGSSCEGITLYLHCHPPLRSKHQKHTPWRTYSGRFYRTVHGGFRSMYTLDSSILVSECKAMRIDTELEHAAWLIDVHVKGKHHSLTASPVAKLGLPDSPMLPLLALPVVRSPALPQKAVAYCELLGFPQRAPCFWSFLLPIRKSIKIQKSRYD